MATTRKGFPAVKFARERRKVDGKVSRAGRRLERAKTALAQDIHRDELRANRAEARHGRRETHLKAVAGALLLGLLESGNRRARQTYWLVCSRLEERDQTLFRQYECSKGLDASADDVDPDRGRREWLWDEFCRRGLPDRVLASYAERAPELWSREVLRAAHWVRSNNGLWRPGQWEEQLRAAGWERGQDGRWRRRAGVHEHEAEESARRRAKIGRARLEHRAEFRNLSTTLRQRRLGFTEQAVAS